MFKLPCLAVWITLCLLRGLAASHCLHVENCECIGTGAKCVNIGNTMPIGLPTNITKLTLINLNMQTIPIGYFNQFKNLMQLYIKSANIHIIKSCTFQGLHLQSFRMKDTTIEEIESYAFSNVYNVTVFSLFKSKINIIQEYAFYDFNNISRFVWDNVNISTDLPTHALFSFHNIYTFEIRGSHFSTVKSLAINQMSGQKIEIFNNTFTTIECSNKSSLVMLFNNIVFMNNKLWCDCDISWIVGVPGNGRLNLIGYLKMYHQEFSIFDNLCIGPLGFVNITLSQLTMNQLLCPDPTSFQKCFSLKFLAIDPPFSTCKSISLIKDNNPTTITVPPSHFRKQASSGDGTVSCRVAANELTTWFWLIVLFISISR